MLRIASILLLIHLALNGNTQGQEYFNNIYNHENGITTGISITEADDGYIGYGVTLVSSSVGQKLVFIKIDESGNELIWKQYGIDGQSYYPGNAGGALINTFDNNFALAFNYTDSGNSYGALLKINSELDTIWKKNYSPSYITSIVNCIQTSDSGYMLTGWVYPTEEDYSIPILLKTDNLGNYQWHQTYGGALAKRGQNVIETPDKGYLIGGLRWDPAEYHSLDAMVIKTDSLGNQEWTRYYGNPDVDDDMAHVAMASDGNYLVATVFGEWIIAPESRTGRTYLIKVDNEGSTIWEKKIGPKMYHCFNKNLRETNDGHLVSTGFYYSDTISEFTLSGFMYKFTKEGDSIWLRDYCYFSDPYDDNMFYDAFPTSDNGYIAIGKARPDEGGSTNKMWVVKVDSMGCDTPGCFTTVINEQLFAGKTKSLKAWPNPTNDILKISIINPLKANPTHYSSVKQTLKIYNLQGLKIDEILIPENANYLEVDVSKYTKGIYYLQYIHSDHLMETIKFIKN
jgi:hypothetical protein